VHPAGVSWINGSLNLLAPPAGIAHDQIALATAYQLNSLPQFNADDRPDILTGTEVAAILSSPFVYPHAKAAVQRLIPHLSSATSLPPASGVPAEREQARRALAAKGIPVFSGIYPPDEPIPDALKQVTLAFPFPPGVNVVCQQQHNTMADQSSHGPHGLRYSIDFAHPDGTSKGLAMVATAPGTAYVYAGARDNHPDNWGLGNVVLIDHGNGYASMYAHADKATVKTGDRVETGDEVAKMGLTGSAGNAHLHFQVVKLLRTPNPRAEEHHGEFADWQTPRPPMPFEPAGVPYFMQVEDLTSPGTSGRISSFQFVGGEAGALMERAHTYSNVML
jgi:murein DD-endopeptidase MepM/ murein hydrolase activator NlpD